MNKQTLAILLVFLMITACKPLVEDPAGSSGIEGQVTLAECYGDQIAVDCIEHKPYQATFQVLDGHGSEVIRFQTDEEGNFKVELEPGDYVLHPILIIAYPIALNQIFAVQEEKYTHIDVVFDSGVR